MSPQAFWTLLGLLILHIRYSNPWTQNSWNPLHQQQYNTPNNALYNNPLFQGIRQQGGVTHEGHRQRGSYHRGGHQQTLRQQGSYTSPLDPLTLPDVGNPGSTPYYNTIPPLTPQVAVPNDQYRPPYSPPRYFLPAPPGQTPYCARGGQTYCEYVEYYPKYYPPVYRPQTTNYAYPTSNVTYNTPQYNENIDNNYGYNHHLPPAYPQNVNFNQTAYSDTAYNAEESGDFSYGSYGGSKGTAKKSTNSHPIPGYRGKRQTGGSATLCHQNSGSKIVRAALTNGQWMFVVNVPEVGLTQRVSVNECVNPNGGCRTDLCAPPSNVRTRCVQQMVNTRLVALDKSGEKLTNEIFQLPSGCVCSFQFV